MEASNVKAMREALEKPAANKEKPMEASSTKAVGSNVKLREAYEFAEEFLRDYGTDWKLHNKLCDMLKSALAEPPRNCDVYTGRRFRYDLSCDKSTSPHPVTRRNTYYSIDGKNDI